MTTGVMTTFYDREHGHIGRDHPMWGEYERDGYRWGYYADTGGLWVDDPDGNTLTVMPWADIKPYWMRLRFIHDTIVAHKKHIDG